MRVGEIRDLVVSLVGHRPPRRNARTRSILVVSTLLPSRGHAGGVRILDIAAEIRRLVPDTTIDLFSLEHPDIDFVDAETLSVFDRVHISRDRKLSFDRLPDAARHWYDVVDIQYPQPPRRILSYRQYCAKLLFTPMESAARRVALAPPGAVPEDDRRAGRREERIARLVDEVVCVSEPDADCLRRKTGLTNIGHLDTCISRQEFADRIASAASGALDGRRIVFAAFFGAPPNREALDWYLDRVHRRVVEAVPDAELLVVGRGNLATYRERADRNVRLVGEVANVADAIAEAAIGIAPLFSGSGFRGKVNQYAVLGLPCVATSLAASGLAYEDGKDIFVTEDPIVFADHLVRLLRDPEFRRTIGDRARERCLANYSWSSKAARITEIYEL